MWILSFLTQVWGQVPLGTFRRKRGTWCQSSRGFTSVSRVHHDSWFPLLYFTVTRVPDHVFLPGTLHTPQQVQVDDSEDRIGFWQSSPSYSHHTTGSVVLDHDHWLIGERVPIVLLTKKHLTQFSEGPHRLLLIMSSSLTRGDHVPW